MFAFKNSSPCLLVLSLSFVPLFFAAGTAAGATAAPAASAVAAAVAGAAAATASAAVTAAASAAAPAAADAAAAAVKRKNKHNQAQQQQEQQQQQHQAQQLEGSLFSARSPFLSFSAFSPSAQQGCFMARTIPLVQPTPPRLLLSGMLLSLLV